SVRGFDLVAAHLDLARNNGVEIAADNVDAVRGAEVVITMLPGGAHVLAVYAQVMAAAAPGILFVDCSTIDVESARQAHAIAGSAGMHSIDSPVSGGVSGAAAATLTLMAGGSDEAFNRARPLLQPMAGR